LSDFDFTVRVLKAFAEFDGEANHELLWWRTDGEYAPVTFFVMCSDLFWWATCDSIRLTPENIGALEQATRDCLEADRVVGGVDAPLLFCCRVRGMRPQGAYYGRIEKSLWHLFDACGPRRDVSTSAFGNPKSRPGESVNAE
jgi:hypothetical protein